MLTRFDHLSQPHALLMTADVLDLVCDRTAVGRLEMRQCFRERFAWDINAEHLGGNPGHDVGRESQPADVERRIARRLAAERIEMRGEVAEISVRPDERIGGGDVAKIIKS